MHHDNRSFVGSLKVLYPRAEIIQRSVNFSAGCHVGPLDLDPLCKHLLRIFNQLKSIQFVPKIINIVELVVILLLLDCGNREIADHFLQELLLCLNHLFV